MGNPFCPIELHTGDVEAAKTFYKKVFDWKLRDMPQMGYTMIEVGAGLGGGMTKKPMPEAPTQWLSYVEVASVKKSIERAQEAGANVVVPYQSIGEMGAIGIFIDPTGAGLGVWERGKAAPKPAKKDAAKKPAAKRPASTPAKKAKRR